MEVNFLLKLVIFEHFEVLLRFEGKIEEVNECGVLAVNILPTVHLYGK